MHIYIHIHTYIKKKYQTSCILHLPHKKKNINMKDKEGFEIYEKFQTWFSQLKALTVDPPLQP